MGALGMAVPVVMQSLLRQHQVLLQLINFSMVGSLCRLPCSLGIFKLLLCALQQLLAVLHLLCTSLQRLLCMLQGMLCVLHLLLCVLQRLLQSLDLSMGAFKVLCLLVQLLTLLL